MENLLRIEEKKEVNTDKEKLRFIATKVNIWDHFGITRSQYVSLKLVSAIFYQIFIFPPNGSPLKTMKNVFYFI